MATGSPPDPDQLLQHAAFIRGVAWATLHGDDLVDDVVQETWVAALGGSPRKRGPLAPWLAGIARNKARDLLRRRAAQRRRDAAASRSERVSPQQEVVDRLEIERRLIGAVQALPEHYRTPLVLRYLEDLPPRVIAVRLDLPVNTVRTRVRRGLAQLRAQLEADHGDGARDWRLALVPLLGPPSPLAHTAVGLLGATMAKKSIALVSILILLGGVAAVVGGRLLSSSGSTVVERPTPGEGEGQGRSQDRPALVGRAAEAELGVEDRGDGGEVVVATGRVVDERRRPVAGAKIVVLFDGVETARVYSTADGAGSFEVPIGSPTELGRTGELRVRSGGRGASQSVWLGPDTPKRSSRGVIVVKPMQGLKVRVSRSGEPCPGAQIAVRDMESAVPNAIVASGKTAGDGTARFEGLTATKVGVFAVAEGTGRAFCEVELPASDIVEVSLPDDRAVTIQVTRAPGGEPVEGAEVFLAGEGTRVPPHGNGCLPVISPVQTDGDGRAVVSGLPPGYISVVARAPGLAMRNEGMRLERVYLEPDQAEITVTLHPYRAIRFPIRNPEDAPDEGARLDVRRYQPLPGYDVGAPEGRIENGHLVLEPFPPGFDWGHVSTEDGSWAAWRVPPGKDSGDPVRFSAAHDVRIRLLWSDGTPAADQVLRARLLPRGMRNPLRTDRLGCVVFPACAADSAIVSWAPRDDVRGIPIAFVSLTADPGPIEVTIDRHIEIAVGISIAGVAGLPAEYSVSASCRDPRSGRSTSRAVNSALIAEDLDRSEIRFPWLPLREGEVMKAFVQVDGMPDASTVLTRDASGIWRGSVDLMASTALRVRIDGSEDLRYWLVVECWNAERELWAGLHTDPVSRAGQRAVEGVHTFRGYPPGRYRLSDHESGIRSPPFDLVAGGDDLELVFDLRDSVLVAGRVVAPEGERMEFASVRVEGRRGGSVSTSNPVRVQPDGGFTFRARRGDQHRLIVNHPLLQQDVSTGEFVVGDSDPILRLVSRPQIAFRIGGMDVTTPPPDPRESGPLSGVLRVRLVKSGSGEGEAQWAHALAAKGVFRLAVPEPGTWSVTVMRSGFPPLHLEDVSVGQDRTDLGTLVFGEGATLDVRLLRGRTPIPQSLSVHVKHAGELPYTASSAEIKSGDPPFIRVEGLGAGTFEVTVEPTFPAQGRPLLEQQVRCDGTTPIVLDLQLP